MDFELTDEQKDIQKAAAEFAQGEFDPDLAQELDQNGAFPEAMWKKAGRLGFIGIHYPEEFGGQGLSLLENVLVIETFWISSRSVSEVFRERDMKLINLMKFLKIPLFPPFVKSVRLETEGD